MPQRMLCFSFLRQILVCAYSIRQGASPRGEVANVLDSDIRVTEFELQSHSYICCIAIIITLIYAIQ